MNRLPLRRSARGQAHRRRSGQAMVEFALTVPTLITMLLFSMYFVEFVRAKLKVQEASRFIAWEMTSFTLSDYGSDQANRNTIAFNTAKTEAVTDAIARYRDLESLEDGRPGNLFVSYSNVAATVNDLPITPTNTNVSGNTSSNPGGPIVGAISNVLTGSVDKMYDHFKFNLNGKVEVEVTAAISSQFLPRNFLNDSRGLFNVDQWGGTSLQNKPSRNKFTLVASGWHLNDGADALMTIDRGAGGPRAGVHNGGSPHGIYKQVKRMHHLGILQRLGIIPGLNRVMNTLAFLGIPNPFDSAFAVAHNYGLMQTVPGNARGDLWDCKYYPGHTAPDGMQNLERDSKLDYRRNRCYDTAPFRDQADYGTSGTRGSEYAQMFNARGPYFMGCQRPEADDPSADTVASSVTLGDRNTRKMDCRQ